MEKKTVKTLSELVSEVLYNNYCKGKACKNCKYNTENFYCRISMIIKLIEDYEKENDI